MKQKIIIKKVIINSNEEMSRATSETIAKFVGTETVTVGTRELRLSPEDAIFVKDLFTANETLFSSLNATEIHTQHQNLRIDQLEKELQEAQSQLGTNINTLNIDGQLYWVPQEVAEYFHTYCSPTVKTIE